MGSGKLVLLATAVLGTGILAAAVATHGMRRVHRPHDHMVIPEDRLSREAGWDHAGLDAGARERRAWGDEGLSMIDMPAWPFGRAEWEGDEDAGDPAGTADLGRRLQPDAASGPGASIAEGSPASSLASGPDPAAEAAERAASAAADAIAAEHAVN